MALFRKKPLVVEAVRYVGLEAHDLAGQRWMSPLFDGARPAWLDEALHSGRHDPPLGCWPAPRLAVLRDELCVETLEGSLPVKVGDWIIRGVAGELYTCKPDIFAATYDVVADPGVAGAAMARCAQAAAMRFVQSGRARAANYPD